MGGVAVLVVDDEPDFVATYRRLLARHGCRVAEATGRTAALDVLGRCRFELVIADLRLPDGDGLEVVRAARAAANAPAVIVVTGFPSEETRRQALAAGAAAYLTKPFPISQFDALVDRMLAARGVGPAARDVPHRSGPRGTE
mgnify:CR=1 FL=1